jgi:hypothetical protein
MPGIIDNAIEHFNSKEVRKTEVPEWESTVYAKNLTLEDKAKMLKRSGDDNTDYLVYALIFGLVDEKGDSVFTLEDKVALRKRVDPDIVSRLATFVLAAEGVSEEDREKN